MPLQASYGECENILKAFTSATISSLNGTSSLRQKGSIDGFRLVKNICLVESKHSDSSASECPRHWTINMHDYISPKPYKCPYTTLPVIISKVPRLQAYCYLWHVETTAVATDSNVDWPGRCQEPPEAQYRNVIHHNCVADYMKGACAWKPLANAKSFRSSLFCSSTFCTTYCVTTLHAPQDHGIPPLAYSVEVGERGLRPTVMEVESNHARSFLDRMIPPMKL